MTFRTSFASEDANNTNHRRELSRFLSRFGGWKSRKWCWQMVLAGKCCVTSKVERPESLLLFWRHEALTICGHFTIGSPIICYFDEPTGLDPAGSASLPCEFQKDLPRSLASSVTCAMCTSAPGSLFLWHAGASARLDLHACKAFERMADITCRHTCLSDLESCAACCHADSTCVRSN